MKLRQLSFAFCVVILLAVSSFAGDLHHLLPHPKASFEKATGFIVNTYTPIVVSDSADGATLRTAELLQTQLSTISGQAITLVRASQYDGPRGIFIGVQQQWPALATMIYPRTPDGEKLDHAQGYILDIDETAIMLAGADSSGLFYGVITLVQLTNRKAGTTTTGGAHIYDYPDYPIRWLFSQHNLLIGTNLNILTTLADTMAMYKLNGIQQNDYKYTALENQGNTYFQNVDSLRRYSLTRNVSIIPGVVGLGWSDGILAKDPNLAEGLHAVTKYVIEADTGRIVPDPRVTIANGGFEDYSAGKFKSWTFYDGQNDPSCVDPTTAHSGVASARCSNFLTNNPDGNARFSTKVNCNPNSYYVMSFWYKTDAGFSAGDVRLLAIGGTDANILTFTALKSQANLDWTRAEVTFNTLNNTSVNLYCGVWGAQAGTIWFDDFSIKSGGLTNVLRRSGTPLTVTNAHNGTLYTENVDFNYISDPTLDASQGTYFPWHTAPTFRRTNSGNLHNGDTVSISYYHPFAAQSDNSGNGSVMACVSEDTLYQILTDQISRVKQLGYGDSYFMGQDEIRNFNHDAACSERGMTAANLLADNITHSHNIVRTIAPSADIFMWSDMVDSLHNAHNNYYLVNGDLSGDWLGIPKDITIVNWNSGNDKASLQFFANHGFRQITAPYYDAGNTSTILKWRKAQDSVDGIRGMMYTTWANDYRFIIPFASYAWSAGPTVFHMPLDSSHMSSVSVDLDAEVNPDPLDKNDAVTTVFAEIYDLSGTQKLSTELGRLSANKYHLSTANLYPGGYEYRIFAQNKQGFQSMSPLYRVAPLTTIFPAASLSARDTLRYRGTSIGNSSTFGLAVANIPKDANTISFDSLVISPRGVFTITSLPPTLILAGATKQIDLKYTPTSDGESSAILHIYYSHGSMKDVQLIGTTDLAVENKGAQVSLDISIVPNPFTTSSMVRIHGASTSMKITLTDLLGRVTTLAAAPELMLNASQLGLHEGTYVLRVDNGATSVTRNVVVLK